MGVVEDMAQVSAAVSANGLGTLHAQRGICFELNRARIRDIIEAWPTAAGIKFGITAEQLRAAIGAGVHPAVLVMQELACKRRFSRLIEQNFLLVFG